MSNYQEYQVRIYANGTKHWHQNGQLHRVDEPAIECTSGNKHWYQSGQRHRVDGPAIEWADGSKHWYQNGQYHRIDGPAVEWANGDKYWYLKGIQLSEQEFLIQTQPQPSHPCADKVVEIDGKKFKLISIT